MALNNSFAGVSAGGGGPGLTEVILESCFVSGNGYGVAAVSDFTTATAFVSNSTVTHNTNTGLRGGGISGSVYSRGNNTVERNATNTSGNIGSYTAR
jgi:hypothetical protein